VPERVEANLPEGVDVTISYARAHLPELVDAVRSDGRTVYLSRYGKRVAALVPPDAAEFLARVEDEYYAKRAQEALASGGPSIPLEQVIAELEALDNERAAVDAK
jgi:prevent-host-death family protein